MTRLILDTQCLLSAIRGHGKGEQTILATIWRGHLTAEIRLLHSEASLDEIARVLDYESIKPMKITPSMAFSAAVSLLLLGEYVAPVPRLSWPSLSDPDDWYLLDLLYHSNADALLSRDTQVLKAGRHLSLPIFSPAEFSL